MSEKRKPIMTAREIGLAASFGGAAFAWRALGLQIPLVPPFLVELAYFFIMVGSSAGGWLVGLICGVARSIPSAGPISELPTACGWGVIWAIVYDKVVRPAPTRIRYALPFLLSAPIIWPLFVPMMLIDEAFGWYPLWPTIVTIWPIILIQYIIMYPVLFGLLMKLAPGLLRIKKA